MITAAIAFVALIACAAMGLAGTVLWKHHKDRNDRHPTFEDIARAIEEARNPIRRGERPPRRLDEESLVSFHDREADDDRAPERAFVEPYSDRTEVELPPYAPPPPAADLLGADEDHVADLDALGHRDAPEVSAPPRLRPPPEDHRVRTPNKDSAEADWLSVAL